MEELCCCFGNNHRYGTYNINNNKYKYAHG